MLSQEEIDKQYLAHFPDGTPIQEVSDSLASMKSVYLDEFRYRFCNSLLYMISEGYTKYGSLDFSTDSRITLFCRNAELLPPGEDYFRAVRALFLHDDQKCFLYIRRCMKQVFAKHSRNQQDAFGDESFLVDWFFEPFKEAFPGFWSELGRILAKYPVKPGIPELCQSIEDYYRCNTDEDALNLLLAVSQKYPDLILVKELIGYTYYSMKMWNNAAAYFESVEDQNIFFRSFHLFFMMAYCYGKSKNKSLEEQYYRKTLEEFPEHIDALNNLGYCLYSQKRLTEAKTLFEKCLSIDNTYRYAVNNYVRVLIALGRNKDAKAFIRKGHKVAKDLIHKVNQLGNTNAPIINSIVPVKPEEIPAEEDSLAETQVDLGIRRQQFSSEKLLEDELTARIEAGIEVFGMRLKMYRRKGEYGRQFIIPIGRLDLLCEDDAGNLYIIELKKDAGYDDAYQQTAEYLDWFEHSEYAKGRKIYGIICLNSPSRNLIEKVHGDKRMRIFEYQISYTEL